MAIPQVTFDTIELLWHLFVGNSHPVRSAFAVHCSPVADTPTRRFVDPFPIRHLSEGQLQLVGIPCGLTTTSCIKGPYEAFSRSLAFRQPFRFGLRLSRSEQV